MKSLNKKYIIFALITCSFIACKKSEGVPEDLEGMKKYVSQKKVELKQLQQEIDDLNKEILKMDPPKEKAAQQVKTVLLQPKEFERFVDVQGQVMADDIVNASSDIGGRIMSLSVKEGDRVSRGSLIAVTDMSTLETQIAEITTALSLATTVFERQDRLWKQNIGSELQFLEAKNNKERLEKSLSTLESQIAKKNVYAPISGIVDKTFLSQGETAAPGLPIVQILNTSKLKIVADLQESLLGSVKRGDKVEVFFPALEKTTMNTISMLGRTIDPANRTFKIEIGTNSLNGQLKPNLMAQVKFKDMTQKDAIIIPIDAIQEDVRGNKFVFVTKQDGKEQRAEKRLIEIGESNGSEVIVIIGLDINDKLITAGGMSLSDNDLIIPTIAATTDGE